MQKTGPLVIVAEMAKRTRSKAPPRKGITRAAAEAAMRRSRAALSRFRERKGLTVNAWETEAGLGQGALGKFLRDPPANQDIGLEALLRLALCQGATVAELIGETGPAPSAAIDRELLAEIIAGLERYLADTAEKIDPQTKARMVMVAYDAAKDRGGPGKFAIDDLFANLLQLAGQRRQ
jgi:hypothetical protein